MGLSRSEPIHARVFARHSGRALAWSAAAGAQDSGRPLRGHPVRSYRLGNRAVCRRLPEGVCEEPQRRIGRRADRRNGFRSRPGAVDEKSPSLSNERPCFLLRAVTEQFTLLTRPWARFSRVLGKSDVSLTVWLESKRSSRCSLSGPKQV